MNETSVLEDYFNNKKEVFRNIICYYRKKNYKFAIWGAGNRGKAFLKVIGEYAQYINFAYDINEKKHNTRLPTGQLVVDYHDFEVEVIFLSYGEFEMDVYRRLNILGRNCKIINTDHIISGDLNENDLINTQKINLTHKRTIKLCALTVLYNPDISSIENIKSYINEVQTLFIYDNTENKNLIFYKALKELDKSDKIIYLWSSENEGVAKPINVVSDMAIQRGYDWIVTFDQDSRATINMINLMTRYIESVSYDDAVAIVTMSRINSNDDRIVDEIPYLSFVNATIQSGAMHNLKILKKIGGYDENIFIDHLDLEYCARCRANGYKIVKINKAALLHGILEKNIIRKSVNGQTLFIGKYSPVRYYYRHRNALYCIELYKNQYPLFTWECQKFLNYENVLIQYDNNYKRNNRAIQMAEYDFKNRRMGKIKDETIL